MQKNQNKQILVSILVGAIVAFLTTLFDGLLTFLQDNANTLVPSGVAMAKYLISIRNV